MLWTAARVAVRSGCPSFFSFTSINSQQHFLPILGRTRLPKITALCCQASRRTKYFWSKSRRRFRPRYNADKVNSSYKLIYEGSMRDYYKWCTPITYLLAGPSAGISLYLMWENRQDFPYKLHLEHPMTLGIVCFVFSAVILGMTYSTTRRSISRIYRLPDSEQYVAVLPKWNLSSTTLEFDLADTSPRTPSKVLKFAGGNLLIKGKPYLVQSADFVIQEEFNCLMGWSAVHIQPDESGDFNVKELMRKKK